MGTLASCKSRHLLIDMPTEARLALSSMAGHASPKNMAWYVRLTQPSAIIRTGGSTEARDTKYFNSPVECCRAWDRLLLRSYLQGVSSPLQGSQACPFGLSDHFKRRIVSFSITAERRPPYVIPGWPALVARGSGALYAEGAGGDTRDCPASK